MQEDEIVVLMYHDSGGDLNSVGVFIHLCRGLKVFSSYFAMSTLELL